VGPSVPTSRPRGRELVEDPSTKVGAVLVDPLDNTIVSLGYNGFPRRVKDLGTRLADRGIKLQMTVHAELNALLTATQLPRETTVYTWPIPPCSHCAGALIQANVTRWVSLIPTSDQRARWGDSFTAAETMALEAPIDTLNYDQEFLDADAEHDTR
jgi:dCMP deaminase